MLDTQQALDILVLGLGNVLLKDEGVGVHIAQELQQMALPDNVEAVDGGTGSLDILLTAQDIQKLVVIDSLRTGKEAGTVYTTRLRMEEYDKLEEVFSVGSNISLHQMGLIDSLAVVRKMDCAPKEIVIIGVEPENMDWGLELTDKVKQRIPEIINMVIEEIKDVIY